MVPGAGLEPARGCPRGILSPLRLPISPPGLTGEFRVGFPIQFFHSDLLQVTVYHNATQANR